MKRNLGIVLAATGLVLTLGGCTMVSEENPPSTPATVHPTSGDTTSGTSSEGGVPLSGLLAKELKSLPVPPGTSHTVSVSSEGFVEVTLTGATHDEIVSWYADNLRGLGLQTARTGDYLVGTGRGVTVVVNKRGEETKVDIAPGVAGEPDFSLPSMDIPGLPSDWADKLPTITTG